MYTSHNLARFSHDLKHLFRGVSHASGAVAHSEAIDSIGDVSRPARIHRDPTALLKALAACVKDDPTAPNYRYHDDPFLIPLSNVKKRAYALSAEAGRRAAVWIRSEHEGLFSTRIYDPPTKKKVAYHNADPPIEAYLPQVTWDSNAQATEKDVLKLISLSRVEESIIAYRSCKDAISTDTKLALLQLLTYNNCTEPTSDRWTEERWFRQGRINFGEKVANTWNSNGLAEELFNSLEEKSSVAYCTMIAGMCKYHQAARALELVQEARSLGIQLNTTVYNYLLRECGFLKQGGEQRRALVKQFLADMDDQNLTPDIGTLNGALEGVLGPGGFAGTVSIADKDLAPRILAEMEKRFNIVPCASTWYLMLSIFCHETGPRSDILRGIVTRLEEEDASGKPDSLMPPRATKDTFFFVTAMQVCSEHLQDTELAKRLDALLQVGERKRLLADSYRESIYRRYQVSLYTKFMPLAEFLPIYDTLVPHRYIPEPSIMESILRAVGIDLTDFADKPAAGANRLEKFWNQILAAGLTRRQKILELMVQITALAVKLEDSPVEKQKLSNICDAIWQAIESQPSDRPFVTNWTGNMLADMVLIYKECGNWESGKRALLRLRDSSDSAPIDKSKPDVYGVPKTPESIVQSVKWAIENKDPKTAAAVVTYLYDCNFSETSEACRIALKLLMSADDLKHFSTVKERELDMLDGYIKELMLVYRNVPDMNSSSSSSTSSESSSDDELESEKEGKEDQQGNPTVKL